MRLDTNKYREFETSSRLEWLETNFTGAYAMGTVAGVATRRYHTLLTPALHPPGGRRNFFPRIEETIKTHEGIHSLSSVAFPGRIGLRGHELIEDFQPSPPRWTFRCGDVTIQKGLFLVPRRQIVILRYLADANCLLHLRPFLADREPGGLQSSGVHIRPPIKFEAPGARFREQPLWYRDHAYDREEEQGLPYCEDLYTPGIFEYNLRAGEPAWLIASVHDSGIDPEESWELRLKARSHPSDPFLARRSGRGWTILAGMPWASDRGRDAMIALPGLLLPKIGHKFDVARSVLQTFAGALRHSLIPESFPEDSRLPDYASVDTTLWWFVASHRYLERTSDNDYLRSVFFPAAKDIIPRLRHGTQYGIKVDPSDGLITAGSPDTTLTWMDSRIAGQPVVPRYGKAVEVNALWYNALRITAHWARHARNQDLSEKCFLLASKTRRHFRTAFWSPSQGCLRDTVASPQIRPNQVLAAALPFSPLEVEDRKAVVRCVLQHLLTPYGLRSLSPEDPEYRGMVEGEVEGWASVCHQGSSWPWFIGHFFDALLGAFGRAPQNLEWCRDLLKPIEAHKDGDGCLGLVAETFDGNSPHNWNGLPAQASAFGEYLRAYDLVRADRVSYD